MKIKKLQSMEVVVDVLCDVCGKNTNFEYGVLQANWGYESTHDGDRYEVHLCEICFFETLTDLRARYQASLMPSDENFVLDFKFGLVE